MRSGSSDARLVSASVLANFLHLTCCSREDGTIMITKKKLLDMLERLNVGARQGDIGGNQALQRTALARKLGRALQLPQCRDFFMGPVEGDSSDACFNFEVVKEVLRSFKFDLHSTTWETVSVNIRSLASSSELRGNFAAETSRGRRSRSPRSRHMIAPNTSTRGCRDQNLCG